MRRISSRRPEFELERAVRARQKRLRNSVREPQRVAMPLGCGQTVDQ